jgi:hypothetical protein
MRSGGIVLILLGVLHLAVTPFITRLIDENASPEGAAFLSPPMLLNHVVVGLLLLPLGVLTFYAASSAVAGMLWAVLVTRIAAVTVAALPVTVFVVMGTRYFGAPPFVAATILACLAALALLAASFWPRSPAA